MPLSIVRNDITRMKVDAIVNAANRSLLGGGGVDGAIHRAAGPELLRECRELHGCETGQSKITGAYRLPCKYVIHTVGPVWRGGGYGERAQLASCYRTSLALALEHGCESVAFPLISAGAYGYPKDQALQVAMDEIANFLMQHDMTVYIVAFTRESVEVSARLFQDIVAYIDDVYVEQHFDAAREAARAGWEEDLFPEPPVPMREESEAAPERRGLFGRKPRRMSAPDRDGGFGQAADGPILRSPTGAGWEPEEESGMPWEGSFLGDATPFDGAPIQSAQSLDELLSQVDEGFTETLLRRIDQSGMTDAECYKRANVDRRLFNKIKNNPGYRPSKQTALAFAIALRLSLEETRALLQKAGYALTHASKSDIVVEYCILHGNYNLMEINSVLFRLDLQPLGY